MKRLIISAALVAAIVPAARAEIFLDREAEPLPLVDLKVVLPIGFEALSKKVPGAGNVLGDVLESGTAKLDRTAFLERLADFGATLSFGVSNEYSQWNLSFPVVEGKNYDELIALLKDNWQSPRWTDEVFATSKVKLEAALKGSLDRDSSLAVSTLRRWINKYEFGGRPLFLDDIAPLKIEATRAIFEQDIAGVKDLWAGAVAPDSAVPVIRKILTEVFSRQGKVKEGTYLKRLPTPKFETKEPTASRTVLLIDKDQRSQTVTALMAVRPDELKPKEELGFFYGTHVFFESGLASVFSDEIRTKRGLAYSVGSLGPSFHDRPVVSLFLNPVKERTDEALQTVATLLRSSFQEATTLSQMPAEVAARQWQSFRYGRVLTRGTPAGRLGERLAVVTGDISADFFKSDVNKWKVDEKQVTSVFKDIWARGSLVYALVGKASELQPLVEKHFPGAKVRVINYRDSLSSKAYPDKLD